MRNHPEWKKFYYDNLDQITRNQAVSKNYEEQFNRNKEAKERRDSTPEAKRNAGRAEILKTISSALSAMEKANKKAREDLFAAIKKEYEAIKLERKVEVSDLKEIVKFYKIAFEELKHVSENELFKSSISNKNYNEYEMLFAKLVEELDSRFLGFAPKSIFSRSSLKFAKLKGEDKEFVFKRIQKLGLLDNEKFMENYGKYFEDLASSVEV